ncbi:MAG: carboxymuconolactone decarboxylase family protein [bacterium]
MDNRIKELIAVGASVTANCQPCLRYHVSKAQENGANEREIVEAIEAAKLVRKGAITKMDQLVATIFKNTETEVNASTEGCGCG